MTEEKKDIVVIARQGYTVLLNVGTHNLTIDNYTPVNLSNLFSEEQLKNCASLRAHKEDGNLIDYAGEPLLKDPYAVEIKPLVEAASTKIEAKYSQKTQTAAKHMQVETEVEVDEAMKQNIQARVKASKEEILAKDNKLLTKEANVIDAGARPQHLVAMTPEKLQMNVTMDVDLEEFKNRQKATHKQLIDKDKTDNAAAAEEIVRVKAAEAE